MVYSATATVCMFEGADSDLGYRVFFFFFSFFLNRLRIALYSHLSMVGFQLACGEGGGLQTKTEPDPGLFNGMVPVAFYSFI